MRRQIAAIVSVLVVLVLSLVLDFWLSQAQLAAGRSFDFTPLVWRKMIILLLFAAAILALAWSILIRAERSLFVSLVCVGVGLIVTAATTVPVLMYAISGVQPGFLSALVRASLVSPTGFTANAGSFMLMIGLASLVLRAAPSLLPQAREPLASPGPVADTASRAR